MTMIDMKVVDKVKKLLNLARDGGATEAEANLAMERAEAILLDNNLSMAMVEASGGSAVEARLKDSVGNANFRWQRALMKTIAETCFCYVEVRREARRIRHGATADRAVGYDLIGRVSNVVAVRNLYEYLIATTNRMRKEYVAAGEERSARDGANFIEGLADRLRRRIEERHEMKMRAQKEEADRRNAAAKASGTTNAFALVVVMTDYAAEEKEANEDIRRGWPVGTTKAKREAEQRKCETQALHFQSLKAEGIDPEVAWDMAYLDWTREKAEAYETRLKAQRAAEAASGTKQAPRGRYYRGRETHDERVNRLNQSRKYTQAWQDGRAAADKVGLDDQVGKASPKKQIG